MEQARVFKISIRLTACLLLSLSLPLLVHFAKSFVLSSACLFSLPPPRLHGWRWRPLINFSRWLALFVRRYGILPLRFSNRSSILDPFDPSIAFCLLLSFSLSLFLSFCLAFSRGHQLVLSLFFPLCTRVCVGSRLGGTNSENTRENAEDEEKDEGTLFLFQERSFEYEYALIDS